MNKYQTKRTTNECTYVPRQDLKWSHIDYHIDPRPLPLSCRSASALHRHPLEGTQYRIHRLLCCET